MRCVASIIPLLLSNLAFAEGQALKLDTGNTAWMLTATALVMLMSLPGLAVFYGGLAMVFTAYTIASVVWVIYGYTLAFGTDIRGVIGSPCTSPRAKV